MRHQADLQQDAEWLRPGDVRNRFGIGRAKVYQLINSGKIRSVCIREPHKAFGMRLINAQSIRDFIEGGAAGN